MFNNWKIRVNVKARLNRHLRIIKESIWVENPNIEKKNTNSHFNIVLFLILLVIPIYPSLASFMYDSSTYDFYRGDIDESSIIESYYSWDDENDKSTPLLESTDSFISVNTVLNDERDLAWTNEIVKYEVKPWDSFSSISYDFKVSTNSIFWANDFKKDHIIHPWDLINVPPVTWIIHKIESWETIFTISEKYEVSESKIIEQNWLEKWSKLISWEVLVIPWAIKKAPPKPVVIPKKVLIAKTSSKTKVINWWKNTWWKSQFVTNTGKYKLSRRQPKHSFAWWNCTWYVAQYKNVTWWWNANQWMKNARAKWVSTWSTPTIWAIIQFNGRWYNPRYGHVWIVTDIIWSELIISDMNYRRINEVTSRKISINDRSIQWYIYVD